MKYQMNQIYNMDCLEAMKDIPDNYFELAIVDPPYGIDINSSGRLGHYGGKGKKWDNAIPTIEYFKELERISNKRIVWGGNYFNLGPTKCFLIWDKKQPSTVSFASCEMAWTNFEGVAKTFYLSPMKADKDGRIHPTQKPVALYKWLLKNYANKGDKILDTHLGSGSSIIACHDLGFEYMAFELDKEYYDKAIERIEEHKSQISIFDMSGVIR